VVRLTAGAVWVDVKLTRISSARRRGMVLLGAVVLDGVDRRDAARPGARLRLALGTTYRLVPADAEPAV